MTAATALEEATRLLGEGLETEARDFLARTAEVLADPLLFFNVGILWKRAGKPLDALGFFEKAAALDEGQAQVWNEIGLVYDDMGRSTMAEGFYRQAVELDPELASAWNNWGVCAFLKGRHEQARERFSRATDLDPRSESAWFNLRDTLEALGDLEGARRAAAALEALESPRP